MHNRCARCSHHARGLPGSSSCRTSTAPGILRSLGADTPGLPRQYPEVAMSSDKRWRLVCYDIRDPARWRNVYRIVRGAGTRVQYSIFRCRLDDRELAKLRWELAKVMDAVDSLLVVDLCPRCAGNVISRNHVEGWTDPPATFRVLSKPATSSPSRQALPQRSRSLQPNLAGDSAAGSATVASPDEQLTEVHQPAEQDVHEIAAQPPDPNDSTDSS